MAYFTFFVFKKKIRVARWVVNLLGGIFLGVGLLLYGQAQFLHYIKEQVDSTFFLLRWVGKVSFIFMDVGTQVPLALAGIPDKAVQESERWAFALLILGSCMSLLSLFMNPVKKTRR